MYRKMRFLPKQSFTSFTQLFSSEPALETYIDITKTTLSDQLSSLFQSARQNLPKQQRHSLKRFKQTRSEVTIKPADKNLGLVVMNTSDYIQVCTSHLANTSTYLKVDNFPALQYRNSFKKSYWSFPQH